MPSAGEMKPPRALMTEIRGESSSADQVKFGENIVITGRDLTVVDMSNQVSVSMVCKDGKRKYDCWSIDDMIEHTPTRIVVPFPAEFKRRDRGLSATSRTKACWSISPPKSESYTAAKGGIAALTHALAASLAEG